MGIMTSRMTSFKYSTGKYFITLDPDDLIDCNLTNVLYNYVKKEEEYDIIEYPFYIIYQNSNQKIKTSTDFAGIYKNKSSLIKIRWRYWSLWSRCYKREIIEKTFSVIPNYIFNYNFCDPEDFIIFFIALIFCKSYRIIDFYGYYYFKGLPDSAGKSAYFSIEKKKFFEEMALKAVIDFWAQNKFDFVNRQILN